MTKKAPSLKDASKQVSKQLDQFYTAPSVAKQCYETLLIKIPKIKDYQKIEPAVGTGNFYNIFHPTLNVSNIGIDIDPKITDEHVYKDSFLTINFQAKKIKIIERSKVAIITNPPFGKKGKLAIDFFNRGSEIASVVALIVPIQFRKWSVQKHLNKNMTLIHDETLAEDSFIFMDKSYSVRCCFQIWIDKGKPINEIFYTTELSHAPIISHPDFEMYQYNCTKEAEKFFHRPFDFAVLRQGFGDYKSFITNEKECNRKNQWILFKARNKKVLKRLKSLDFEKLSHKNTSVPGFGKADVVAEYISIFGGVV